jgi:hypothetical protein
MFPMRQISLIPLLLCLALSAFAREKQYASFGFNGMAGYRYDDLRSCVASGTGEKGGPIGDIMLDVRKHFSDENALGFKLPVMRPILFGAAFKMLQFEPEFIFERTVDLNGKYRFVIGPGLGVSLNYGPDYKTDWQAPDRKDFFSSGPFVSCLFALGFRNAPTSIECLGFGCFMCPCFQTATVTAPSWAPRWRAILISAIKNSNPVRHCPN